MRLLSKHIAMLLTAAWLGTLSLPASQADQADRAELTRMLQATTGMWNRGDLEGFIAPYAEDATFMTAAGPVDRAAMRVRYQSRYFTGSKPDQQLRFEELEVRLLGRDHALMTGRFVLTGGGKADQTGRFTLVWRRAAGGWRIIHDHSS